MSFLLPCPQCGPRDVYEFRWGGEVSERPAPGSPGDVWVSYLYLRQNEAGAQREWWYHRMGCQRWFVAVRDTVTNDVTSTSWPPALADAEAGTAAESAGR